LGTFLIDEGESRSYRKKRNPQGTADSGLEAIILRGRIAKTDFLFPKAIDVRFDGKDSERLNRSEDFQA
jgi:hypothetical protein